MHILKNKENKYIQLKYKFLNVDEVIVSYSPGQAVPVKDRSYSESETSLSVYVRSL